MTKLAPEFGLLSGPQRALVRKIGTTPDHRLTAENGAPGKGWLSLEDAGWIRITQKDIGGYTIGFTLNGWERWCRQVDAEDGRELQPLEFD